MRSDAFEEFSGKKILFSQIRTAAPSEPSDDQLFPRGILQNKLFDLHDKYDMCDDRGLNR